jgi:hypothetical protein
MVKVIEVNSTPFIVWFKERGKHKRRNVFLYAIPCAYRMQVEK